LVPENINIKKKEKKPTELKKYFKKSRRILLGLN